MSITVAVTPGIASEISGQLSYYRELSTRGRHTCRFRCSDHFWVCPHNHVVPSSLVGEAARRAAIARTASLIVAAPRAS